MLETVRFPTQRKAFRMVKYPVKHGGGKHRVSHHLSPLLNLLVGGKDDGGRLIGVTDESEEAVFENHFGGIYYVYVRGTVAGSCSGIYARTWKSWQELETAFKTIFEEFQIKNARGL